MVDETLEQTVRRLAAIEEIKQLKASYFRCVDGKLWDEFATLFTDDLVVAFDETTSGAQGREQFVAAVERHFTGSVSVHLSHDPEVTVLDGDHAKGVFPMFDLVLTQPDSGYESHTGYGHYHEEYRRVDGRWRISRSALTRVKRDVLPK
jgi:ketosteroid isomerase-like protein